MNAAASTAIDYLDALSGALHSVSQEALERTIELLLEARASGKRIYTMGNGGSAAIASQFVCNLVKTAQVAGHQPLRAFALTDNIPSLTAWSNDTAYDQGFAQQITALVDPGDVVIAISCSGNSPNILNGLRVAESRGASTIGLLGFDGGAARDLVDIVVLVPYPEYGLVEDTHMAIGHALTRAIQRASQMETMMVATTG
jgi:D-sedoheptulose 7-phosphate isomerase